MEWETEAPTLPGTETREASCSYSVGAVHYGSRMGNSSQRSLTAIKIFRFPRGMMGRRVRVGDSRIGHHIPVIQGGTRVN